MNFERITITFSLIFLLLFGGYLYLKNYDCEKSGGVFVRSLFWYTCLERK